MEIELAETILNYWFGKVEGSPFPPARLTHLWFGEDPEVDREIRALFATCLEKAIAGGVR